MGGVSEREMCLRDTRGQWENGITIAMGSSHTKCRGKDKERGTAPRTSTLEGG